jgi:membrane associated rhomboid family serine protease
MSSPGFPMPSDELPQGGPIAARKAREPIFDAPFVVVALVGLFIAIHAFRLLAPQWDDVIVDQFAFAPARLTLAFWPEKLNDLLARANLSPEALQQARLLREFFPALQEGPKLWTLLTYGFLHGSWSHVGLNSIWIIAFGPPLARRVGAARFLALTAVTAIAGALVHWAFNMADVTPLIGASAADSGLMAAAARFIFERGGPLGGAGGYSLAAGAAYDVPAPPLRRLARDRRVVIFVVIWLATNFIFGAGAQTFGLSDAPVAWIAHVGGFAAGLFLFPLFDRRRPPVTR